jgi:hypothetical protein
MESHGDGLEIVIKQVRVDVQRHRRRRVASCASVRGADPLAAGPLQGIQAARGGTGAGSKHQGGPAACENRHR